MLCVTIPPFNIIRIVSNITDILITTIKNPASRIDIMANSDIQMCMDENEHIIRQVVHVTLFMGKQELPFCGDNEDLSTTKMGCKSMENGCQ